MIPLLHLFTHLDSHEECSVLIQGMHQVVIGRDDDSARVLLRWPSCYLSSLSWHSFLRDTLGKQNHSSSSREKEREKETGRRGE